MTHHITTVALCSPNGKLGPYLLKALQSEGFSVTLILRESSKASFPPDQDIIRLSDEYGEDELTAAFKTVDAVVLSLPLALVSQSPKFAKVSLAAGNRWLIASTYGANLEDPRYHLFPASVEHRKALLEIEQLRKGNDNWAWTAITCGPWAEIAMAANAWHIDVKTKTAELIDNGTNVFTTTTRDQTGLAVARVLKRQLGSMRNKTIYISSFEVDMLTWLDAIKKQVGPEGWKVTSVDSETVLKRAEASFAAGNFLPGYLDSSLALSVGHGFENCFSKFTILANEELGLPQEDLAETIRNALSLPSPFA